MTRALPPLSEAVAPPVHGADLHAASARYGIPVDAWLDLSTGINPRAYPLPALVADACRHLPHGDAALLDAARHCYGTAAAVVAGAGSQTLIQWLPLVRAQATQRGNRIAVPAVGYSEHAFRWHWAGHELLHYDPLDAATIDTLLDTQMPDVLVVIHAHNPFGIRYDAAQLLEWRRRLAARGGWLVVDEAFVDATPAASVAPHAALPGLVVLRSLGKFFGLAGLRCGFALCAEAIAAPLRNAVGPWAVAGPTLQIAEAALRDTDWQHAMRAQLPLVSAANAELLQGCAPLRGRRWWQHALFNTVELAATDAVAVEDRLARDGIRVRRIERDAGRALLRFGLVDPADEAQWQRCERALRALA